MTDRVGIGADDRDIILGEGRYRYPGEGNIVNSAVGSGKEFCVEEAGEASVSFAVINERARNELAGCLTESSVNTSSHSRLDVVTQSRDAVLQDCPRPRGQF